MGVEPKHSTPKSRRMMTLRFPPSPIGVNWSPRVLGFLFPSSFFPSPAPVTRVCPGPIPKIRNQLGPRSVLNRGLEHYALGLNASKVHARVGPIETSLLDEDPPAARSQMQTVSDGSCQTGIDPPSARPFAGYDGLSSYWVMRVQDHPTTYYVAATTVMAWRIVKYFSDPRQPPAAARKRSCQLPFLRSCRFRSNL